MPEVRIRIREQERSYPIYIEQGGRYELGKLLRDWYQGDRVFLVSDHKVNSLYGQEIGQVLEKAGLTAVTYLLPQGEKAKSFSYLEKGYELLLENDFKRDHLILALGGGVVGDLAGFLAATFMRGLPYIQIPTTLLAQVDSSIGGKTAINHRKGKNLIGSFYQPQMVLIDPGFLTTLAPAEFRNGMAEVLKHGLIADQEFASFLLEKRDELLKLKLAELSRMIYYSCRIKAGVVTADEKEQGIRAHLNFGHTIGHALEAVTGFNKYKHGEAVAVGMIGAARLAQHLNYLEQATVRYIEELLSTYDLPLSFQYAEDTGQIFEYLFYDKKVKANKLRWVLLKGIGSACLAEAVDEELVKDVLEGLK